MTPQQLQAMKMALDLTTMHHTDDGYAALRAKVRSASKEALAQQEQEPVAWTLLLTGEHTGMVGMAGEQFVGAPNYYQRVNVYTASPQRKPLSDEEIKKCWDSAGYTGIIPKGFARAIEAAHGIKENT